MITYAYSNTACMLYAYSNTACILYRLIFTKHKAMAWSLVAIVNVTPKIVHMYTKLPHGQQYFHDAAEKRASVCWDAWEMFIVARRLSSLCSAALAFLRSALEAAGRLHVSGLQVEAGDFTEECTSDGVELWQSSWSTWELEERCSASIYIVWHSHPTSYLHFYCTI